jgi:hypothetical protein
MKKQRNTSTASDGHESYCDAPDLLQRPIFAHPTNPNQHSIPRGSGLAQFNGLYLKYSGPGSCRAVRRLCPGALKIQCSSIRETSCSGSVDIGISTTPLSRPSQEAPGTILRAWLMLWDSPFAPSIGSVGLRDSWPHWDFPAPLDRSPLQRPSPSAAFSRNKFPSRM